MLPYHLSVPFWDPLSQPDTHSRYVHRGVLDIRAPRDFSTFTPAPEVAHFSTLARPAERGPGGGEVRRAHAAAALAQLVGGCRPSATFGRLVSAVGHFSVFAPYLHPVHFSTFDPEVRHFSV